MDRIITFLFGGEGKGSNKQLRLVGTGLLLTQSRTPGAAPRLGEGKGVPGAGTLSESTSQLDRETAFGRQKFTSPDS